MAAPGPAPKPTALKVLEGNPGKRQLNTNEPRPQPVAPTMPDGLPDDAAEFWEQHAPKLETLGILTEVDGPAFVLMAIHYALAREAARTIQDQGLASVDENGAERKHPLLQAVRDNSTAFRMFAQEFGLTPSSRSRLSIPEPVNEDDFFGF